MKLSSIYVKLALVAVFIGASFNLASYAVGYLSAPSAAAWRFGTAALIVLVLLYAKERMRPSALRRNWAAFLLLGIVGVFGFNALFFEGMMSASPLNGSLIMAANPMVAALLARLLLRDRLTRRQLTGILVSLLGVVLVLTQGSWELVRNLSFNKGDLLIVAGNVCWALYAVLNRKLVKDSGSLATTAYTMAIGALGLIALASVTPSRLPIPQVPAAVWGAIAFMAAFTSVLGYLWWNEGVGKLGVGRTSIFFNLVPIVTMLISLSGGAAVSGVQLAGTACVLAGVIVTSTGEPGRSSVRASAQQGPTGRI